jgi:hypothetical protein
MNSQSRKSAIRALTSLTEVHCLDTSSHVLYLSLGIELALQGHKVAKIIKAY